MPPAGNKQKAASVRLFVYPLAKKAPMQGLSRYREDEKAHRAPLQGATEALFGYPLAKKAPIDALFRYPSALKAAREAVHGARGRLD